MHKTVVIGDIHGRSTWKLIVNMENPDRVIFVGDYFDSFDFKTEEQANNFLDIIEYKKKATESGVEVVLLIGNHDHHYYPEIGYTGTSGYQQVGKFVIEPIIDQNRGHLQVAYQFKNYLFSHAGVSTVFMDDLFGKGGWNIDQITVELNELFRYKPHAFTFNGWDPYGNDDKQTPIWIRPTALMRANKNTEIKKRYIQIHGHTENRGISLNAIKNAYGNKYYNVDCLGSSGEYLIIEGDKIKVGRTVG
jgi:hypothetical protein